MVAGLGRGRDTPRHRRRLCVLKTSSNHPGRPREPRCTRPCRSGAGARLAMVEQPVGHPTPAREDRQRVAGSAPGRPVGARSGASTPVAGQRPPGPGKPAVALERPPLLYARFLRTRLPGLQRGFLDVRRRVTLGEPFPGGAGIGALRRVFPVVRGRRAERRKLRTRRELCANGRRPSPFLPSGRAAIESRSQSCAAPSAQVCSQCSLRARHLSGASVSG